MILLKNADVYSPEHLGIQDILIGYDRILDMGADLQVSLPDLQVVDAGGKIAIPGLIDQHVHLTGGGGESGFASRVPEIQLSQIIASGVTTVVGLLGTDSRTRSVENLVAKTKALNAEGITAYCLTGAYEYPSPTITGSVGNDLLYISEVLGVKLAISDHRCSHVTNEELIRLASEVRIAGLISHKPAVVHLHTGVGQDGLNRIVDIVNSTDIPVKHFRPTHIRQTKGAEAFAALGGYLDFTSGNKPAEAAEQMLAYRQTMPWQQMTLSSDANGSQPVWNEQKELIGITAAKMNTLYETILALVQVHSLSLTEALQPVTVNVAKALELYPRKGTLAKGSDADIILLDDQLAIDTLWAKGTLMMADKQILIKGTFE